MVNRIMKELIKQYLSDRSFRLYKYLSRHTLPWGLDLTFDIDRLSRDLPIRTIFDVGANNGSSSVPLAIANPTHLIFAFEPTPEMIEVIQSKIVGLENYVIVPKAVSDYNGTAEFNVAGNWDWGCSSLLKFSRKSQTDWPGRTDFHVT
ncbi:MAG: Paramecium bursaria Chlorella virus, partial [Cyanobacteriota bacterium]